MNPTVERSRKLGVAAIISIGIGMALVVQSPGWSQSSYFAMVRAFAAGTATIDAHQWETGDKIWLNGHFFSPRAPGLPTVLLPAYLVMKATGATELSESPEIANRPLLESPFKINHPLDLNQFGDTVPKAKATLESIYGSVGTIWALGLLGSVLPAVLMMLMLRAAGERFRPGTGAVTAVTVGLGTIVLPLATRLLSHTIAAMIALAAFMLVVRERSGKPSLRLLAAAAFLAGFAAVFEYPLILAAAIVGCLAVLRERPERGHLREPLRRAGLFAGAAFAGVAPLLAYNWWAFGDPRTMSYTNVVVLGGISGHDRIGYGQRQGFFGINMPNPSDLLGLLVEPRGMIAVTPIFVLMLVGLVLMYRDGERGIAASALAIVAIFWLYVSAFLIPMGGNGPGPRYLTPVIPFAAFGLPYAWKRFPSTTLVFAAISIFVMISATITEPLIDSGNLLPSGIRIWWEGMAQGYLTVSVGSFLGLRNGWAATAIVVWFMLVGLLLAGSATPRFDWARDRWIALAGISFWVILVTFVSPHVTAVPPEMDKVASFPARITPAAMPVQLVLAAALAGVLSWLVANRPGRRPAGA